MEKKLAIAIDDSIQSLDALKYAAELAGSLPDLRFELLHIQSALSQYLTHEARQKPKARRALEKAMQENEASARTLLEKAAERLHRKGVNEEHIQTFTAPRDTGVANDILALGRSRSYDAILAGRRSASHLREWVMGSVAANLVEHAKVIPIWVVDGQPSAKKILLAADGSQASLKALDHLAFILAGSEELTIHVLHVEPRFKDYCRIDLEADTQAGIEAAFREDERSCMRDFHAGALGILANNKVSENRYVLETASGSLSIPRTILSYAREHDFGTIVMGRRGRGKNMLTGSVSRSLLYKSSGTALWIVP